MGMRQNIALYYGVGSPIYLYSHWDGDSRNSALEGKLKLALMRGKERWDDESYLARIIFSEMIKDDIDGFSNYGLSPYEIDPEFKTIEVDLKAQTVNGIMFSEYIN